MFKFLKNASSAESKKKLFDDGSSESDERCSLTDVENSICDNLEETDSPSEPTKLHRNLIDILNDRTTLSSFVQFLETRDGLPLVKFWLDCEAFKAVQKGHNSTLRLESRNSNYDTGKQKLRRSVSTDETFRETDDCVSISTASCSESNIDETEEIQSNAGDEVDNTRVAPSFEALEKMNQSLTDDEKSKICEKSRKEIDSDTKSSTSSRKYQPTSILEDALRIYRKYLVTDSVYSVELPATIMSKLSLALCETESSADCDSNDLWEAFEDAQRHVLDVMEREHLSEFLESAFYCKYVVEVLTSESLSLREILHSESALFYFMEFLEQDRDTCKLPYLEFWLAATNFRKQNEDLKSDALVIYEKFFSLQATTPLNFSNKIRTKVEEAICSSDLAHCFDLPVKIVEVYLERCCFKKFQKSQLFFKHLSEVMSKIDGSSDKSTSNGIIRRNSTLNIKFPTKIRHRRTNSDVGDRKGMSRSISTQNTLLAGLDHKKNKNPTDLHIDARQLADPDLLWRRKNSMNGLSFGRVDAMGRYERDFELPSSGSTSIPSSKSLMQLGQLQNGSIDVDDPQALLNFDLNNTQNRFKNAMRKLVHLPEDSVQQEIAWQVAEMIVKDVTSITLSSGNMT